MTIQKRNRIHRQLAETYARLTCYLGTLGQTPGEIETHHEYIARTRREYQGALTHSVPALRLRIEAARQSLVRRPSSTAAFVLAV